MIGQSAPCMDCPDRLVNSQKDCHADCSRYEKFVNHRKQVKTAETEWKRQNGQLDEYAVEKTARLKRKRRREI